MGRLAPGGVKDPEYDIEDTPLPFEAEDWAIPCEYKAFGMGPYNCPDHEAQWAHHVMCSACGRYVVRLICDYCHNYTLMTEDACICGDCENVTIPFRHVFVNIERLAK